MGIREAVYYDSWRETVKDIILVIHAGTSINNVDTNEYVKNLQAHA